MAGLLEFIGGVRGDLAGYRDAARAKVLGPVLGRLEAGEAERRQGRAQEAYGRAAAALSLNAPDIGAIALLARADPAAASGLLTQAAQSRTPEAEQSALFRALQIQGAGLSNQVTAGQLADRPLQNQVTQEQLAGARQRRQQDAELFPYQRDAARRAAAPPPAPTRGQQLLEAYTAQTGVAPPSGYRPELRTTPDGQAFVDIQPIEGTKPFNDGLAAVRASEDAYEMIEAFLDDLAAVGTEFRGADAMKLRQRRDRILANYAQLQNLGVLQPGEVERLDRVLPDPTAFGAQFNPRAADNIAATYEQLLQQTGDLARNNREAFWWSPFRPIFPEEQSRGR